MNSTNIKVMSEEIQRLKDKLHAIDIEVPDPSESGDGQILTVYDGEYVISDPELPAKTEAATGDVLGLVGESKTPGWITPYNPPAYSETETATGQKWVDGKDIYCIGIEDTLPEITQTGYVAVKHVGDINLIYGFITIDVYSPTSNTYFLLHSTSGNLSVTLTNTSSEKTYRAIAYYTKNNPVPSNETTATKKKTTKKGE